MGKCDRSWSSLNNLNPILINPRCAFFPSARFFGKLILHICNCIDKWNRIISKHLPGTFDHSVSHANQLCRNMTHLLDCILPHWCRGRWSCIRNPRFLQSMDWSNLFPASLKTIIHMYMLLGII